MAAKRRARGGAGARGPAGLLNLGDYEAKARSIMPKAAFTYFSMGSEEEDTLRDNRASWRRLRLVPRVMLDVSAVDTRVTLLGCKLDMPVVCAPVSMLRWVKPQAMGAVDVARAARSAGVVFTLSCSSNVTMEKVASSVQGSPKWFQLYVFKDRALTARLIKRAERAGYTGLVVTLDHPVLGNREASLRPGFSTPPHLKLANLATDKGAARRAGKPGKWAKYVADLYDQSLTWDDIGGLVSTTTMKVVVKGVLSPQDAALAVEHGVHAIVVSNHGGRQLDGAVSTATALPGVVAAVGGRVPVLVDGGVRRGVDVMRALAMGASGVMLGRPLVWGLAVNGHKGVSHVLDLVREELRRAMALCGCKTIADVSPSLLAPSSSRL